jgi:hypothetical protein
MPVLAIAIGLLGNASSEKAIHAFQKMMSITQLPGMKDVPAVTRLATGNLVDQYWAIQWVGPVAI